MTLPVLHPADVTAAPADSFRFYGLLPSDTYDLAADWPIADLRQMAALAQGQLQRRIVEPQTLDHLALALLAHRLAPLPDGLDWLALADACAHGYAEQLRPEGQRSLRMRLMRLNFMLRDLLDCGCPDDAEIVTERRFEQGFVWDWLPLANGQVIADSRQQNVHHLEICAPQVPQRLGLPTQIDALSDGRVAVESCYSDGWFAWSPNASAQFFPRQRPIVLVFEQDGERFELDADGAVRRGDEAAIRVQLPIRHVWCARRVGELVVASDWSEAGWLVVLNLQTWRAERISSGPVLLTNDICEMDGCYYLIDKMQGRVFAFDRDFSPLGARLRFGKGPGRLYDPIAIRAYQGHLHVLSWITGALATIRPF